MKFLATEIPDVIIVEPDVYGDSRGFFLETFHTSRYAEGGIEDVFVQDNHSHSKGGILRGLHAQLTHPQGKLVRAIEGEVYDVAVDIRLGSPTYKKFVAVRLSGENFRQLYIPPGFAHGFCVTTESVHFEYKCTDFYDAGDEIAIAWNDPDLGIPWPLEEPSLSARDAEAPRLREIEDRLPHYSG